MRRQNLQDPIDQLLHRHGLRRTVAARNVLGWFLSHPETSFTHADLQQLLPHLESGALDRVTLYRLVDRLTQCGLLLCRVDARRVRRYQAMPASVLAAPHFECQTCHREQPLALDSESAVGDFEPAARTAVEALERLGYRGLSVDVAVRGVCAECAAAHPREAQ